MEILSFSSSRVPALNLAPGAVLTLGNRAATYGSRVLLVTGANSLDRSGHLDRIKAEINERNLELHHERLSVEPTVEFVDELTEKYRPLNIDLVIGVGGGSVVDGAKAVSGLLPQTTSVLDYLEGVGEGLTHDGRKTPYIAVPTTAGTGGEATKNAVISRVGDEGFKKSIRHNNLVPDEVILDPELALDCPPGVTAACGLDAFTQLLEPYLSPKASPFTDALAWSGMARVRDNLKAACSTGAGDPAVRGSMAYAAFCSGVALANAGLGVVHGLAGPIGGFFPAPHGMICGTLLSETIRVNVQALRTRGEVLEKERGLTRYAAVGGLLNGTPGRDRDYNLDALQDVLDRWLTELPVKKLGEYGVSSQDVDRILAGTASRDNPIQLTEDEIRAILEPRI